MRDHGASEVGSVDPHPPRGFQSKILDKNGSSLTKGEGMVNGLGFTSSSLPTSGSRPIQSLGYRPRGLTNGLDDAGSGLKPSLALINGIPTKELEAPRAPRRRRGRKARRFKIMMGRIRKKAEVPVEDIISDIEDRVLKNGRIEG